MQRNAVKNVHRLSRNISLSAPGNGDFSFSTVLGFLVEIPNPRVEKVVDTNVTSPGPLLHCTEIGRGFGALTLKGGITPGLYIQSCFRQYVGVDICGLTSETK